MRPYLFIFFLLFVSCISRGYLDPDMQEFSIVGERKSLIRGNFVTIEAVKSFARNQYVDTKTANGALSIEPYVGHTGDTLMYIVNYGPGDGWKIVSADARTPAIIAEGDTGLFSMNSDDSGIEIWMDILSNTFQRIISAPDSSLSFSERDIMLNKAQWTGEPVIMGGPTLLEGHWEETVVDSEIEYIDSLDHFVPKWHQSMPYNQYSPLKTDGSGNRKPAGCVAVAGAEVLYYLHNKFGIPKLMYTRMEQLGDTLRFSQPDSTVWATMSPRCQTGPYNNLPEALMIRYIGAVIQTGYENDFSWALPMFLRIGIFNSYGYPCIVNDYDEEIVKSSVLDSLPVIVTASDQLIPVNGRIHSFVIDGYRIKRTKITVYHHWIPELPLPDIPLGETDATKAQVYADYYSYSYSEPEISDILINWGWSSQWSSSPTNNGWYSLTAGWEVSNGGVYDYNHNIKIIHDFSLANYE